MILEVREARVRAQIDPTNCSENSSETQAFLFRFVVILGPQIDPKWVRFGIKIDPKTHPKINAKIEAKMNQKVLQNGRVGGRGVARCGGGGKPPPQF